MNCNVVDMNQQHVTCEINRDNCSEHFIITYVYAKCKDHLRKPSWDSMLHMAETIYPWCIIGDFNVILLTQEKMGGRDYNINKSSEFINIIESCGLVDMGYNGQPYTWCNHRNEGARNWKRLDRVWLMISGWKRCLRLISLIFHQWDLIIVPY